MTAGGYCCIFQKGQVRDFEVKVILGSLPDFFMGFSLVSKGEEEIICLKIEDYLSLNEYLKDLGDDDLEFFDILEIILCNLIEIDQYIIRQENVNLTSDRIYYNESKKSLKFTYNFAGHNLSCQESLIDFLNESRMLIPNNFINPYIEELVVYLERRRRKIKDILLKLEDLKREARISYG